MIPLLVNYFQDRQMTLSWHQCQSAPRKINGGGSQGATLGISEYSSDLLENNQYISPNNLKSQEYLDEISQWTKNQKMVINQKKSKTMIFNYTQKYQFSTRLNIEG